MLSEREERCRQISTIALLTQEIAHQVCCVRDNSQLLKDAEPFHQHPVLDDLALHDAVDGEHPYLNLLAARGNFQPRALVRAPPSAFASRHDRLHSTSVRC